MQTKRLSIKDEIHFFNNFINILTLFFILYLPLFLLSISRSTYQNVDLQKTWSYVNLDAPWTPPQITAIPIIGQHYFGDFQLTIAFSRLTNPYQENLLFPFGMIPSVLPILKLIDSIPIKFAYVLYAIITILSVASTLMLILNGINNRFKLLLIPILTFLPLPIYINLDRGNFAAIATSSFTSLMVLTNKSQETRKISYRKIIIFYILITLSCSFKFYWIIPIFVLLIFSRNINLLCSSLIFIFVNISLSYYYTNGPIDVLKNLFSSASSQIGNSNPEWLYSGIGLNQFLLNTFLSFSGKDKYLAAEQYQPFSKLPILIWILLIIVVFKINRNFSVHKQVVILSSSFFLPPVAMAYTNIWLVFVLALLIAQVVTSNRKTTASEYFAIGLCIFASSPLPLSNHLLPFPLNDWREYVCLTSLVVIGYSTVKCFRKVKS